MPPRDNIHDTVVKALQNDGWTITDDPLKLDLGIRCCSSTLALNRPNLQQFRCSQQNESNMRSLSRSRRSAERQ